LLDAGIRCDSHRAEDPESAVAGTAEWDEDLVEEPFHRLIGEGRLSAYPYDGFWAPMDTLKDKHVLETLLESGKAPWRTPRGISELSSAADLV